MTNEQSIERLVARAREGDRGAFETLVARHRDRLLASIRNRRGPRQDGRDEAEDVLNETLVRAFQSLPTFELREEDSFLRWLFTIARNVEVDSARRQARTTLSLSAAQEAQDPGPSPSASLRRNERFERLEKAIAALPPHYREVIRLARIEGLKTQEVAARLGKSEEAVKHILARALRELRTEMGDTESFHLPDRRLDAEDR